MTKDGVHHKVEALTKPECIYTITNQLLGAVPTYLNFTKWFCYPVQHPEVSAMTAVREHILELVPLQNYVDRQLFTNRVDIALEVLLHCRFLFAPTTSLTRPAFRCFCRIFYRNIKHDLLTDGSSFDFILFKCNFNVIFIMKSEELTYYFNYCDIYKFQMLCRIKIFQRNL